MSQAEVAADDLSEVGDPPLLRSRARNVAFAVIMGGMLLAALDGTIVATALPTIVGEMGGIGHYAIEIAQLVAAAATTLAAAIGAIPVVTAAWASLTLLLTGLRQVFGFREKWATRTWALIRIEHEINLYQLNRAHGGDAAGRRLVMQVDAIVAEETHGWAERLRASGSATSGPPAVVE